MDQQLLTFVTVAECESFTKAAEQLFITQSAVSLQMKSLESRYNVKLFERTNKFLHLTKAGKILYTHAKEILNHYSKAQRLIDDLYFSERGPLLIGSSYTFGEYILPELIVEFKSLYPNILPTVSIRNSNNIADQLIGQEIDLGIMEGDVQSAGITKESFLEDELVVIVPANHRLALVEEVAFDQLREETWILREKGSGTRAIIDQVFKEAEFYPEGALEFGSSQIIKEAVERGLGISIMSRLLIKNKIEYGLISPLKITGREMKRTIQYATNNTQQRTKATDLFIDFLLKYDFGKHREAIH